MDNEDHNTAAAHLIRSVMENPRASLLLSTDTNLPFQESGPYGRPSGYSSNAGPLRVAAAPGADLSKRSVRQEWETKQLRPLTGWLSSSCFASSSALGALLAKTSPGASW